MAQVTAPAVAAAAERVPYLEWAPILAGAIGAAALSFLLLTFGTATLRF